MSALEHVRFNQVLLYVTIVFPLTENKYAPIITTKNAANAGKTQNILEITRSISLFNSKIFSETDICARGLNIIFVVITSEKLF